MQFIIEYYLAIFKPAEFYTNGKKPALRRVVLQTVVLVFVLTGLLLLSEQIAGLIAQNNNFDFRETGAKIPLFYETGYRFQFLFPIVWLIIIAWSTVLRTLLQLILGQVETGTFKSTAGNISICTMIGYWPLMITGACIGIINDMFPVVRMVEIQWGYYRLLAEILVLMGVYGWQVYLAATGIKSTQNEKMSKAVFIAIAPDFVCCSGAAIAIVLAGMFSQ